MAEVVCIQKKAPVDGLALFAAEMFHGQVERPGAAYLRLQYREGDELAHPSEWTVNLFEANGVRQPGINWVVPEATKQALAGVPHIAFLQVRMKKVFREPYELAVEPPLLEDLEEVEEAWDLYENDPSLAVSSGTWHELVLPHWIDIPPRYLEGGVELRLEEQWSSGTLEAVVSERLLEEYPIFFKKGVFVRPDVYGKLELFVDERYFLVQLCAF